MRIVCWRSRARSSNVSNRVFERGREVKWIYLKIETRTGDQI